MRQTYKHVDTICKIAGIANKQEECSLIFHRLHNLMDFKTYFAVEVLVNDHLELH